MLVRARCNGQNRQSPLLISKASEEKIVSEKLYDENAAQLEDFKFSDCSQEDSCTDEEFEDSKEVLSGHENLSHLTPSQLPFPQKLAAAQATHQISQKKREANSPAEKSESKKSKAAQTKQKI